jgi:hypothetical protein
VDGGWGSGWGWGGVDEGVGGDAVKGIDTIGYELWVVYGRSVGAFMRQCRRMSARIKITHDPTDICGAADLRGGAFPHGFLKQPISAAWTEETTTSAVLS